MTLLAGPAPVESEQQAVVPWPQGGDIAGEIASQKLTDECSGGFFLSDKVAGTVASRWSGRVITGQPLAVASASQRPETPLQRLCL